MGMLNGTSMARVCCACVSVCGLYFSHAFVFGTGDTNARQLILTACSRFNTAVGLPFQVVFSLLASLSPSPIVPHNSRPPLYASQSALQSLPFLSLPFLENQKSNGYLSYKSVPNFSYSVYDRPEQYSFFLNLLLLTIKRNSR